LGNEGAGEEGNKVGEEDDPREPGKGLEGLDFVTDTYEGAVEVYFLGPFRVNVDIREERALTTIQGAVAETRERVAEERSGRWN
jgi:hypothetical protein